jgi:hypothetical protein
MTKCVYATDPPTTVMLPLHERQGAEKQQKHICSACGLETTDIFELVDHYESFV